MRGRKPKPTFLKLVQGNPGGRAINHDEPQPDGDLVEPPSFFSPRQRIIWQECIANAPPGMLKRLDFAALQVFVVACENHELAAAKVTELGQMVKVGKGVGHNPYVSIMNNQAAIMLKASADLGFSPSSRSRVKVTGKKKTQSTFGKLRELKLD